MGRGGESRKETGCGVWLSGIELMGVLDFDVKCTLSLGFRYYKYEVLFVTEIRGYNY